MRKVPSRGLPRGSFLEKMALPKLSVRQREILRLIAEGKSMREIVSTLEISLKTVEGPRRQLMAPLDIHDVPSLVRYVVRNRIIAA